MAVTREEIQDNLTACGLAKGDQVFVHSSLKSIGWVEGGAETVIRAFQNVLGPDGLMAVPTLAHTFHREPDGDYLVWDKHVTPSRVGALTDTLWRLPGAFRSDHPTHSVAAIGGNAEEFTSDHPYSRPTLAEGSPYMKLVQRDVMLMFLGVSMSCNTTLHAFEEWLKLPYLGEGPVDIALEDGSVQRVTVTGYPLGCRGFYGRRPTHVSRYIEDCGIISLGRVGEADVITVSSRDLADCMFDKLYDEPGFLLCRRDDCDFCRAGQTAVRKAEDDIRGRYHHLRERRVYRGAKGRAA